MIEKASYSDLKSLREDSAQLEIPHGREAVKLAILDAAEELLLERNPNEISVREIAKKANIKHPLIFRHFGSKDELVKAVHARQIANVHTKIENLDNIQGNIGAFFKAVEENKFRQIALARAMIDGIDPHLLQNQFPVMQRFIELIAKKRSLTEKDYKFDTNILGAVLASTALGWILYEPYILAAADLEDINIDDVKKEVVGILEEFIRIHC
jgi:TetR/AcrR family transcriptional regulator, repressor for neighboring sulfatase